MQDPALTAPEAVSAINLASGSQRSAIANLRAAKAALAANAAVSAINLASGTITSQRSTIANLRAANAALLTALAALASEPGDNLDGNPETPPGIPAEQS
jgi:hypothetical protein